MWFGFIPQSIDRVQVLGGVLTTPELAADGLEAVQVGAGSRFAERGHLSSKEWPGMLAFYRNLAMALVGDHPGAS
ncbi:dioxygenase [Mycobacterium tuberculosis]|nr:dioxygenase [Mycobacterium tuberculosis]